MLDNNHTTNRCGWARRATMLAALAATLAAGCSDDTTDGGGGSAFGGEAGANPATAGTSQGGSHVAGSHSSAASDAGGAGGSTSTDAAFAVVGDRRVPYTALSDLAFANFFITHHEMAIEMAEHEVERGSEPELQAMAESMIAVQTAEVMVLQEASKELSGNVPPEPVDPHAEAEMHHMAALSGSELDRMFLLEMIPHHASAIAPAHRAVDHLENAELKAMASSIVSAQAKEIGQMYALLVKLDGDGAGEDMGPADASRPDFGLIGDRRLPLTPANDLELIDFFVPHHEMAVQMADHVIAHGKSTAVIAMAQMMKKAQSAEIELMRDKREELSGSREPAPMPDDPHMTREMSKMSSISGPELDRMFVEEMLVHHSSALPPSHRAKPHVTDPDLQDLTDSMFAAQAQEIGELRSMLEEL